MAPSDSPESTPSVKRTPSVTSLPSIPENKTKVVEVSRPVTLSDDDEELSRRFERLKVLKHHVIGKVDLSRK